MSDTAATATTEVAKLAENAGHDPGSLAVLLIVITSGLFGLWIWKAAAPAKGAAGKDDGPTKNGGQPCSAPNPCVDVQLIAQRLDAIDKALERIADDINRVHERVDSHDDRYMTKDAGEAMVRAVSHIEEEMLRTFDLMRQEAAPRQPVRVRGF